MFRRLTPVLCSVFIVLCAAASGQAAIFKTAQSGQPALIFEHKFLGVAPPGLKSPSPYIKQPPNGSVAAKTSVEGSGSSKVTIFRFFYTSKKGYRGSDSTEVGVNMYVRGAGGKLQAIVMPEPLKVTFLVK